MGEKIGEGYVNERGEFVRGPDDQEDKVESSETLESSSKNLERLKALMGSDFNEMEMSDYLSYIRPEDAQKEIDGLEERLKKGRQARGQILETFKAHLSYVYASK
jgi:hypothetical protein